MIKMLTCTCYNGNDYKQGQSYTVDPKTAERWIKNGIAESTEYSKFTAMTDEQLAEYAESKGIDISRVRSREAAIAKLEKAE